MKQRKTIQFRSNMDRLYIEIRPVMERQVTDENGQHVIKTPQEGYQFHSGVYETNKKSEIAELRSLRNYDKPNKLDGFWEVKQADWDNLVNAKKKELEILEKIRKQSETFDVPCPYPGCEFVGLASAPIAALGITKAHYRKVHGEEMPKKEETNEKVENET